MLRPSDIYIETNEHLYQRHLMNYVVNVFITYHALIAMSNFDKVYPKIISKDTN